MTLDQLIVQAQKHQQQTQWAAAADCYHQARQLAPGHKAVLDGLAWCYSRNGQYAEAIDLYTQLGAMEPQMAKWPYMLGYQYYAQQRWQEAITYFDQALGINPNYLAALYRKGYAHSQTQEIGKALTSFEQCRQIWRGLPEGQAKELHRKFCADAAFQQGKLLLEQRGAVTWEAAPAAVHLLEEAVQLDPADEFKYYNLGLARLANQHYEAAIDAFQAAERAHRETAPNKAVPEYVYDKWAEALINLGRLDEAEQLYTKIPPFQRKAYILRNIGWLYCRLGKYDQAVDILRQAVQKERANHNGHYHLGLALKAIGRWGEAVRELEEAIRWRKSRYQKDFLEAAVALQAIREQHAADTVTEVEPSARDTGVVVRYNTERGFGFIRTETGDEIFFHFRDFPRGHVIEVGAQVEFERVMAEKGPRAIRIRQLST